MDAESEIERQNWHPNVVRMRMVSLPDAALEAITRDDNRRQVERDVAAAILADRAAYNTSHEGDIELAKKHQGSLAQQAEERKAAAEKTGGDDAAHVDGEDRTANERSAQAFAFTLNAAGLKCQAMRTQAIANRGPVKDGWVVNYHDTDLEIGLVATWWGRNHFQAYIEVAGHADRSDETAAMFAELFTRAQGPGI